MPPFLIPVQESTGALSERLIILIKDTWGSGTSFVTGRCCSGPRKFLEWHNGRQRQRSRVGTNGQDLDLHAYDARWRADSLAPDGGLRAPGRGRGLLSGRRTPSQGRRDRAEPERRARLRGRAEIRLRNGSCVGLAGQPQDQGTVVANGEGVVGFARRSEHPADHGEAG